MAVRPTVAVLAVALVGLPLAGCGGGGGGASGPGGGGTGGPGTTAAKPGNSLALHNSGTTAGMAIDGQSTQYGSNLTVDPTAAWSLTPVGGLAPADMPSNVARDYILSGAAVVLYQRPVTVTFSGGTGGLSAGSASGTQYVACASVPTANGCGDQKLYLSTKIYQDAEVKVVTYYQNGKIIVNPQGYGQTLVERTQTLSMSNSITDRAGLGSLQDSYTGQYSDESLTGTLTGSQFSYNASDRATGWFFGGDATPTTDMTALKTAPKATYQGVFVGKTGAASMYAFGTTDVQGDVTMHADFGASTVDGNVYNLTGINSQARSGYGVRMDGDITGTTYVGAASYTGDATSSGAVADSANPGTGQVIGGFFGANAAETTGVVQVVGAQPGGACITLNCSLQGAFGAKKQP